MSGNLKIRYTVPMNSGAAIAGRLESYLNAGNDQRIDVSAGTSGVSQYGNLNFQRALHRSGMFVFNPSQTYDGSGGIVVFDVSNKAIRVRLVDNSGNIQGTKYLDMSGGPSGSSTF